MTRALTELQARGEIEYRLSGPARLVSLLRAPPPAAAPSTRGGGRDDVGDDDDGSGEQRQQRGGGGGGLVRRCAALARSLALQLASIEADGVAKVKLTST